MSNNILGTDEVTDAPRLVFKASPERYRFIAYLFFGAMGAFAVLMTNLYVKDLLAAGPEDGLACGPFNRVSGAVFLHLYNIPVPTKVNLLPKEFARVRCVSWRGI